MNFLDLLAVIFGVHDLTKESFMPVDYLGLLSLLLFMGGVLFWFLVVAAAVMGLCHGIRRLYDSAREVMEARVAKALHVEPAE